uniref:DUF2958 domain-containing protein n=1 Tax=Panagrellus redivivus TaxID=6233 RepID=A0A7E4ZSD7_PANRE
MIRSEKTSKKLTALTQILLRYTGSRRGSSSPARTTDILLTEVLTPEGMLMDYRLRGSFTHRLASNHPKEVFAADILSYVGYRASGEGTVCFRD